ncbi:hypothetical protein [Chitinophaga arvensicola]|uniref:Uncharacterized protein n=1 Tax=Chitinophaga arvensicola TaxID=29529 RepID=A0A1I0SAI2_9BACT|nr:hypothetical protein [Chitinophaga arvensicola]SEW53519.1 hypothetical protein SAMN04488122_5530 [Chitinophaga arvensicola]
MKSLEEIREMLESELNRCIPITKKIAGPMEYFNEYLGNTSFLLVGLLGAHLREDNDKWISIRWMDDSLITDFNLTDHSLSIKGIAIWGIENDMEQWTEPFIFEVALENNGAVDTSSYSFLFGKTGYPEVSYDYFRKDRSIWASNKAAWRYVISIKPEKSFESTKE